ncbi:MAG TPA: CopG family transcriptional regulator [Acidobacteriota bacterium]|nr:CopG family transcriptional regulator [Acidobacteriota bacterium]
MELSKKTTILFPPDLHERLGSIARQRGVSMGELVREACAKCYGTVSVKDRLAAVKRLEALALPVSDPDTMAEESVPSPENLLP